MTDLQNQVRFLKWYSVALTVMCLALAAVLFVVSRKHRFAEIDVERINVIENDGALRLVIANKARQHPGIVDGVTDHDRTGKRPPGMIFFNERGDEQGGLVFDGSKGGGQGGSLTFDKFRGDQTVQFLQAEDANGNYFAGLKMNDQNMATVDVRKKKSEIDQLPSPEDQRAAWQKLRAQGMPYVERLVIGRDRDKASVLRMNDASGKMKIELKVESTGIPSLTFFDDNGKAIARIPTQHSDAP